MAGKRRPKQKNEGRGEGLAGSEAALLRARLRGVPLVGDLKPAAAEAGWSVNESLRDHDEIPRYSLGGEPEGLVPASEAKPVDFEEISRRVPANPLLAERRLELGLVHPEVEEVARAIAMGAEARRRERASDAPATEKRGDA